jgi:hypothetical protein
MKNSIFVICPYKFNGVWCFDDPNVGLVREPFVAGADTFFDVATADIPNAEKGVTVVFSAQPFPTAQIVVEWVAKENNGDLYRWPERNLTGWLCPALLKYLSPAPPKIYVELKPVR